MPITTVRSPAVPAPATDTAPTSGSVFHRHAQTGPRERPTAPFALYLDPAEADMADGDVLPRPITVPIVLGVGVDARGDTTQLETYQQRLGRIVIPEDIEVQAWGQTVRGYRRKRQVGTSRNGIPLWRYELVWQRAVQVGSQLRYEWDADGWTDFRRRLRALLPGKKVDGHIEMAVKDDHERMSATLAAAGKHSVTSARAAEQLAQAGKRSTTSKE